MLQGMPMALVTAFLMSALRLSLLFLYQLCIAAMYKKWQRTKEFFFFFVATLASVCLLARKGRRSVPDG